MVVLDMRCSPVENGIFRYLQGDVHGLYAHGFLTVPVGSVVLPETQSIRQTKAAALLANRVQAPGSSRPGTTPRLASDAAIVEDVIRIEVVRYG